MSLCHVHWTSPTLQLKVSASVLLPDVGEPPFAVYYLLHGLTDDHTVWMRYSRVETYVRNLPLIVVMPDAFRSFYTNHPSGPAYASYIAEDLPDFIERNFAARSDRAGRCIGGLSMGGYGALRVALAYPQRYISANSHSGALGHGEKSTPRPGGPLSQTEFNQIFGANPRGTDHDLLHLAAILKKSTPPQPQFLIDCGTEDFLIEDNRHFHAELEKIGLEHDYREHPGMHNWDYWDLHVRDAIEFHCRAMNIAPITPPTPLAVAED